MKKMSLFVAAVLVLMAVTGCGNSKNTSGNADAAKPSEISVSTEEKGIPDSVRQKLNSFMLNDNFGEISLEMLTVSVNGITYHSTYDDIVERLGLTITEGAEDSHNSETFSIICHTDSYRLSIFGKDNLVNNIIFNVMTENQET